MKKRVLVVAGEGRLRATLAHAVALVGCGVELAEGADRAHEVVTNGGAALAIVAPAGLGAEGLGLARELSETSGALIVVAEEREAVERLSRAVPGAAGYLCEPLKEAEVLARIREVLDLQEEADSPETGGSPKVVTFADCVLDLAAHEFVNSAGEAVTLTRTEFALLSVLVRHPRTVLTRDWLRREIAGRGAEPYERSIDMLVARLRRKVERDARAPVLIVTVPGVGYKFGAIPEPGVKNMAVAPAAVFRSAQKSEAAQHAPRSAERRQLTVLCCNLADLSTLPCRGDPEELQAAMAAFHRCCAEVIERFGGEVDTLLADGLLAYFGYSQAHEDDAERGIRAGLALITAMPNLARAPAIRVGIASGLVVVGELLGEGAAQKHSAVGEALVLAEQLQALAAANEVVIAESTRRLAGGRFNYRDLGLAEAKGFSEPVHAWRVTGVSAAASRFEVRRGAGLSALAGREEELKLLSQRWEQAAQGEGQVVALVGEPGVGKSRLVYEFTRSRRTQDWLVLEGASVSYGQASAYRPVIDLLKGYFRIEDRDDARMIYEKVTGKLLALDEALKPHLVPLLALLEVAVDDAHWVPLDPVRKRLRTMDACKRLLLREAQVQPVTLVFEDLHWIDSETQALLDALVESLPTARLLLLTVFRPEYVHR
ncbi:MAG TPA: AAA family ATPase, partial [Burkholderiales bacterium]|nr:AAA family ATPase [Burkholderiales bacterium]